MPLIIAAGGWCQEAGYQCINYGGTVCHGRGGHWTDIEEGR